MTTLKPDTTFARRVCAVLLADVSGFSKLMGENDERTAHAVHHLQAIAQLGETLEMEPNYSFAHYWLGNAYVQTGELQQALNELHRAKEADPGHALSGTGQTAGADALYAEKIPLPPLIGGSVPESILMVPPNSTQCVRVQ